jgi:hypothetical protein
MKTSSVQRKDQAFWASCVPPRQSGTYLPSALKHLSGCHFTIIWKKKKYYCNISVGLINRTAKNTG